VPAMLLQHATNDMIRRRRGTLKDIRMDTEGTRAAIPA
jgi:hypothetical protein